MDGLSFRALRVNEENNGTFTRRVVDLHEQDLLPGGVLVRVLYSSLNYKDALSASGNKGVTRRYPHTPGIDAAGVVESGAVDGFHPGDTVLIKHAEFGANTPGGFSQYAGVPSDWLMRMPEGLSARTSMAYGTAGLTAALSVHKLREQGVTPAAGNILVTGATGGVGSVAVALLAKLGYQVTAATGKPQAGQWLSGLGASAVIHRDDIDSQTGKALLPVRWAGVVDTVGGNYLSAALRSAQYGGVVTCCGNAASPALSMTVYPFILRGVSLLGIDIAHISRRLCEFLWAQLAGDWRLNRIESLARECSLDDLDAEIDRTLRGEQTGRLIVNPWA